MDEPSLSLLQRQQRRHRLMLFRLRAVAIRWRCCCGFVGAIAVLLALALLLPFRWRCCRFAGSLFGGRRKGGYAAFGVPSGLPSVAFGDEEETDRGDESENQNSGSGKTTEPVRSESTGSETGSDSDGDVPEARPEDPLPSSLVPGTPFFKEIVGPGRTTGSASGNGKSITTGVLLELSISNWRPVLVRGSDDDHDDDDTTRGVHPRPGGGGPPRRLLLRPRRPAGEHPVEGGRRLRRAAAPLGRRRQPPDRRLHLLRRVLRDVAASRGVPVRCSELINFVEEVHVRFSLYTAVVAAAGVVAATDSEL